MELTISILFSLLLGLGVLMTFIPSLPGMPFMFLCTLIFWAIGGFDDFTWWMMAIFVGITLCSMMIDYSFGLLGAKLGGASKTSLIVGFIGMIAGLIVFPPLGAFLGMFAGIFLAELSRVADHAKALKAASYSVATMLIGMILNISLAIAYFVLFLIFIF